VWSRYPEFIADSPNPKVGLAVTEWNAQSTDWRTGLFAAGLLNVFERQDAVRMATPALFLRRVDAPAWDNAFINHDHVSWFPAPNYVVMQLYRQHYQPNRVQLISLGSLNAVATASADGKTVVLKVVNAQPEDVTCTLQIVAPFKPKTGRRWTVQAGLEDRNTLAEPHKIVPVESKLADLDAASTVTFPAYSVTLLELK
jgi:alpha-N-arabinofuranosidase